MAQAEALPTKTEVLVLGGGMAGHCAAIAAAEAGAQTLFLEKTAETGGSSSRAGGGFIFIGTDLQKAAGVEDDLETFRREILEAGQYKNNPELVDMRIKNQLATYEFLRDHGVKFTLAGLGKQPARFHVTGTGRAVPALHEAALKTPNLRFFANAAGVRLLRDEASGRVNGAIIAYQGREVKVEVARAVVLATGGFSRSRKIMEIYVPEIADAVKHGGPGNTGDGLIMGTALGAGHADLGYVTGSFGGAIRNYPNAVDDSDDNPPLIFAFNIGAIMVNKNSERFINEGQSYKAISPVGQKQPDGLGFQIFDQKMMDEQSADSSVNNFNKNLADGYLRKADSIAEAAKLMNLDPVKLEAEVERYNHDARTTGVDSKFGRKVGTNAKGELLTIDKPPFYIAATTNAITSTYGGLAANGDMAIVDVFGKPIPGLFGAGEVVGGYHGALYYSGTALPTAAISGMCAGRSAAAFNKADAMAPA